MDTRTHHGGNRRVLSQDAYERLRGMFRGGNFESDEFVSEAEFVRRVQMGRTPVREALRRLEAEKFVESIPGSGYRVVGALNEKDLGNVYRVRSVLEGLAAADAAVFATRVDIARLEDLYEAMGHAWTQDNDEELTQLNSQFHGAIAQGSQNSYLQGMLEDIRDIFERFRSTALGLPGRKDDAHREHGELLQALRDRDSELARQLAEQHVRNAFDARASLRREAKSES